jgi:hypothetical protein
MTFHEWAAQSGKTDDWIAAQVGRDRSTITHVRNRNKRASLELAVALNRLSGGLVPVDDFLLTQTAEAGE